MIQVLNYNKFMWSVFGKWGRELLQSEADFLIAKSGNFYYKVKQLFITMWGRFYYKRQQILQSEVNLLQGVEIITKWGIISSTS